MPINLSIVIDDPLSSLPGFPIATVFAAASEMRDPPKHVAGGVGSRPGSGPKPKSVPKAPWAQEFWVPHRGQIVRIATKEIDLVTAERDYVRLHVGAASFLLHRTLGGLERQLDPVGFLRLHRSTIVRSDFIVGFKFTTKGSWSAHLRDGSWQRVGRTYLANVRAIAGR
jgi:two-component system response regulator AlgR